MKTRVALLVLLGLAAFPPASGAGRLPIVASQDWWPVWSPDANYLAFTRIAGRTMTLEVVDFRAHRTYRLAAGQSQLAPTWSPDDRIAFSLGGQIYTADPDGGNRTRVTSGGHSYAPAWRPGAAGPELAYLTTRGSTNTDLWLDGSLWARNAIGDPAWSPDGSRLAFQRDDGVYVTTGPGSERRVAAIDNPGAPSWSPDGSRLAYVAADRVWVVAADGSAPARPVASVSQVSSAPSWSRQGDQLAYTTSEGLQLTTLNGATDRLFAAPGVGAAMSPTQDAVAFAGPHPGCPGHAAIRIYFGATDVPAVSGTCEIRGTPGNDVVYGTTAGGDVVLAGAGRDQIHARNGRRDTIRCGAGRDTVWADRVDRLYGCETVHRG